MNWFRRRKQKKTAKDAEQQPPHEHTWKDMPWYMNVRYNGQYKTAGYEIIEPYICVTCGERKNVKLESEDYSNIESEEREKIFMGVRRRYKRYLKPRAVVEDMINPDHLAMVEKLRGSPHGGVGTSANMPRSNYQIKIERRNENG